MTYTQFKVPQTLFLLLLTNIMKFCQQEKQLLQRIEKVIIVFLVVRLISLFLPAHEIMVLLTQATSKGSGKPVHLRSLARAFAVRTHEVWKQTKGPTKNQTFCSTGWLRMLV